MLVIGAEIWYNKFMGGEQRSVEDLLDTVRFLSQEIGPRLSASPAERRAAEHVAERLRTASFEVSVEPFQGLITFSLPYGLICTGCVLATLLYAIQPMASFGLALLSLAALLTENHTWPTLSHLLPKGLSQNVVGIRPAQGEAMCRVILTAHLDSSKAALPFHPKLVPGLRRSFLLMVGAMGATVGLSLIALFARRSWLWYLQLACALYLGLSLSLLLHRELLMKHTPGANDNASGVAVLLEAAERLLDLRSTELWAVATGCEESGLDGMLAFMDAHSFDRENTYFINLDNLGAGRVAYIIAEGMLWVYPSAPELVRLAAETVGEEDLDIHERPFHTLTTDALVPLVRGYKAMSIMAFDRRGLLPHWHWPTDTVENVEPATMETALRLLCGLVRRLDAEVQ